jgi:hypothetical protein
MNRDSVRRFAPANQSKISLSNGDISQPMSGQIRPEMRTIELNELKDRLTHSSCISRRFVLRNEPLKVSDSVFSWEFWAIWAGFRASSLKRWPDHTRKGSMTSCIPVFSAAHLLQSLRQALLQPLCQTLRANLSVRFHRTFQQDPLHYLAWILPLIPRESLCRFLPLSPRERALSMPVSSVDINPSLILSDEWIPNCHEMTEWLRRVDWSFCRNRPFFGGEE